METMDRIRITYLILVPWVPHLCLKILNTPLSFSIWMIKIMWIMNLIQLAQPCMLDEELTWMIITSDWKESFYNKRLTDWRETQSLKFQWSCGKFKCPCKLDKNHQREHWNLLNTTEDVEKKNSGHAWKKVVNTDQCNKQCIKIYVKFL